MSVLSSKGMSSRTNSLKKVSKLEKYDHKLTTKDNSGANKTSNDSFRLSSTIKWTKKSNTLRKSMRKNTKPTNTWKMCYWPLMKFKDCNAKENSTKWTSTKKTWTNSRPTSTISVSPNSTTPNLLLNVLFYLFKPTPNWTDTTLS